MAVLRALHLQMGTLRPRESKGGQLSSAPCVSTCPVISRAADPQESRPPPREAPRRQPQHLRDFSVRGSIYPDMEAGCPVMRVKALALVGRIRIPAPPFTGRVLWASPSVFCSSVSPPAEWKKCSSQPQRGAEGSMRTYVKPGRVPGTERASLCVGGAPYPWAYCLSQGPQSYQPQHKRLSDPNFQHWDVLFK